MSTQNPNRPPGENPNRTPGENPNPEIHIFIDKVRYTAPKPVMTALELRQLPPTTIGADRSFFQVVHGQGDDIKLADGAVINLQEGMRFYSGPGKINPGQPPGQPPGRQPGENPNPEIHIFIDKVRYTAPKPVMTALELRQLPPTTIGADRSFFQVVHGQGDDIKLADGAVINLQEGMRFYSGPGKINPGDSCRLPEEDESYLKEKGFSWDILSGGQGAYLIIKGLRVSPERYDKSSVDLMVQIPATYPMTKLDMFYVSPELRLRGGSYPNAADVFEGHCGRQWQRFSRHLDAWNPGQDGLPSFLSLVFNELQRKE